ncbi:MAG TPA: lipid II flippase MurJ, partial [Chloroflexia bacterium]|nr:lipid II flippase MurJ [Chloroflexia bacterium]
MSSLRGGLRRVVGRLHWLHLSRAALALIALAALNNLLGYGRDIVLAAWYGASPHTDAFLVGSYVPLLIHQVIVVGSLTPAFLPVLVQTGARGSAGEAARWRLVQVTAALAAGSALPLAALLWLWAPEVVAAIAPGLVAGTQAEAVTVLQASLPLVLCTAPAGVLAAALNYHGRFVAPLLGAAAANAGVILGLLFAGPADGIQGAALGMSAGGAAGLLIASAAVAQLGGGQRRVTPVSADSRVEVWAGVRRTALLGLPLLATVGLAHLIGLIERFLSSNLPAG